jgi:MFS family permease
MSPALVPILYAGAMGMAGLGSLVFGRWFDKRGLMVLVPGILMAAAAPAFTFLGGFALAIAGTLLWGLALGAQDVIMSAAVADLVPERSRARAYGIFPAIYGMAWFAGSALLGALYDVSLIALAAVAALAQLAAIVPLVLAIRARSVR